MDEKFKLISHELHMDSVDLDNLNSISREHRTAINSIIMEQDILVSRTLPTLNLYHQRDIQLKCWIKGLLKIKEGYLPPELVHTKSLEMGLKKLQKDLQDSKSRAHVLHSKADLNVLYRIQNTNAFVLKDKMYIHLTVPYTDPHKLLSFYSVTVYPVPIQKESGYSFIQSTTDFIAVTEDRRYFQEITRRDFELCSDHKFHCPTINHLRYSTAATCISAILFGYSETDIMHLCKFQVYDGHIPRNLIRVNETTILFQTDEPFADINCLKKTPARIPLVQSQVINIPCNCYITTTAIQSTIRFCTTNANVSVHYPHNGPASFWLREEIHTDHLKRLNSPISQHLLPNLGQAINHTAESQGADPNFGADLRTVLHKVKQLAAEQDLDIITKGAGFTDYTQDYGQIIMLSLIFVWLLILSGLQLNEWFQRRAIQALTMAAVPGVKCGTLNPFSAAPTTETQINLITKDLITIYMIALIGLLIALAYLMKKIWIKLRSWRQEAFKINQGITEAPQSSHRLELFLRISDNQDFVTLYLQDLPYDLDDSVITQTPSCSKPILEYGLQPTVMLQWADKLHINLTGHDVQIPLRKSVPISYKMVGKMRRILATNPPKYSLLGRVNGGSFVALPKTTTLYRTRNEQLYPEIPQDHERDHLIPPAYE